MYVCPHVPDKYGQITWVIVACTFAYSILDASFKGWWTATVNHLSLWVGGVEIPWASYIIPPLLSLKECLNFLSANQKQNIKDKRKHDSTRRFNFGRSNVRYQQKNAVRAWNRTPKRKGSSPNYHFLRAIMALLVLLLLISQILDDISQIQWTHTNINPELSNPVVTQFFSPNNEEEGEFNSCLTEKKTQRLPQNPDDGIWWFFPWQRYGFFWTAICIYMCFSKYTKIIKNPKYAGREVTIATYALSKSLLITRCFTCCPIQSSSSPLTSYVYVGIPSQDAGSEEPASWGPGLWTQPTQVTQGLDASEIWEKPVDI